MTPAPKTSDSFFARAKIPLFRSTLEGRLIAANDALAELLGWESGESLVQQVRDIREDLWLEGGQRHSLVGQLLIDGEVRGFSNLLRHRSGQAVWIVGDAWLVRQDEGGVAFLEGAVRDARQAEDVAAVVQTLVRGAFARSGPVFLESAVRELAEALSLDLVFVGTLDEDEPGIVRVLAGWNGGPDLGFERYDLEGTPCDGVVGKEVCVFPEGVAAQFPEDALLEGFEGYIGVPLFDQSHRPIGLIVGMTRQVLDGPDFPLTILSLFAGRFSSHLEAQRAVQQMQHAQRLDAMGQLAGGVAHDFNNLLQVLVSQLELALEGEGLPAEVEQSLLEMIEVIERGSSVTRELLMFSRRVPLQPRVIHLEELAQRLRDLYSHVLGVVELALEIEDDLPALLADPGQLDQVVLNLLLNARDAMPDGGRVTVRARRPQAESRLDPERWIALEVCDEGIGMTEETRARVLEPFFSTKPNARGSGLGLAVVFGIVERHGGRVEIDSAPGRGTRVRLSWPAARQDEPRAEEPDGRAEAPAVTAGKRVLLAEDEERIRIAMTSALRGAGYQVFSAANGVEALRLAEINDGCVDVAILDAVMPEKGGVATARELCDRWPQIPVVFCTGYSSEKLELDDLAREILPKPVRREVLLSTVGRLVGA